MDLPQGKYAWMVKIGEKGQFVIPKEARDLFDLQPGSTILVLGDSIIERTRFRVKSLAPPRTERSGSMTVKGHIKGYISGMVDADFNGTIHGSMDAVITAGTAEESPAQPEAAGKGGADHE